MTSVGEYHWREADFLEGRLYIELYDWSASVDASGTERVGIHRKSFLLFFFSLIVGTGVHRASGKGERIADLVSNEET
jgi:hypothetical protein